MKDIKIKSLYNYFLKLLLGISILAIVICCLWIFGEPVIHSIDKEIVSLYVKKYQKKYDNSLLLYEKDKKKAIKDLEALLDDLESIKKNDRLGTIKQNGFSKVIEALLVVGSHQRAVYWSEKWKNFDERDLKAQVLHAKLLSSIPGEETKGMEILEHWMNRVPEAEVVANTYAQMLYEQKKYTDAFIAYCKPFSAYGAKSKGSWHIFWDIGKGFNPKNMKGFKPKVDANNTIKFDFELPPNTKKIRVDPPPLSRITIHNPKLFIEHDNQAKIFHLWELPLRYHQMSQNGSTLSTMGKNDPFFYWDMPTNRTKQKHLITIEFKVDVFFSEQMLKLAMSAEGASIEAELLLRGEIGAIKYLKSIKAYAKNTNSQTANALKNAPIDVYWKKEGEKFSESRKSRQSIHLDDTSELLKFDLLLPVKDKPTELRIDFPDVSGVTYVIEVLEFIEKERTVKIDFENLNPTLQHNIKKHKNAVTIMGVDPHVAIKSQNISSDGEIHIMGVVR